MSPELERIRRLIAGIEAEPREAERHAADLEEPEDDRAYDGPRASRASRPEREARRPEPRRTRTAGMRSRGPREGISGSLLPPSVDLDLKHLQAQRIIAYDGADSRVRPFDSLRAQVLRAMEQNDWTVVGVTSPTPECGKSVIAANLAFSAARQPELDVLLADFDLRRPRIAQYLGVPVRGSGTLGLLRNRADIEGCLTPARASSRPLLVLPTTATEDPSQYTNYDAAGDALEAMRRGLPAGVIVVDLPPVLTSDDGASILPHVDCVVLVTAAGSSKIADVEQCAAQLRENNVVRVVVNKTQDKAS